MVHLNEWGFSTIFGVFLPHSPYTMWWLPHLRTFGGVSWNSSLRVVWWGIRSLQLAGLHCFHRVIRLMTFPTSLQELVGGHTKYPLWMWAHRHIPAWSMYPLRIWEDSCSFFPAVQPQMWVWNCWAYQLKYSRPPLGLLRVQLGSIAWYKKGCYQYGWGTEEMYLTLPITEWGSGQVLLCQM